MELNYETPSEPRPLKKWPGIVIGAVSLPILCVALEIAAELLFPRRGLWPAPALALLQWPVQIFFESISVHDFWVMFPVALGYLAATGGVLGWLIPMMPRFLLTWTGLGACVAGALVSIGYAVSRVGICATPLHEIDWTWCHSDEAAAIQWTLYAIFFSMFTLFLAIVLPIHRRQRARAGRG